MLDLPGGKVLPKVAVVREAELLREQSSLRSSLEHYKILCRKIVDLIVKLERRKKWFLSACILSLILTPLSLFILALFRWGKGY